MCDDNQVTPCCHRYGNPREQCERYPACNACSHLIADDSPSLKEASQHIEAVCGLTGFDPSPPAEAVRDPLY